mgnify:CR=1 FL=1
MIVRREATLEYRIERLNKGTVTRALAEYSRTEGGDDGEDEVPEGD